jgi:hypothetical protein
LTGSVFTLNFSFADNLDHLEADVQILKEGSESFLPEYVLVEEADKAQLSSPPTPSAPPTPPTPPALPAFPPSVHPQAFTAGIQLMLNPLGSARAGAHAAQSPPTSGSSETKPQGPCAQTLAVGDRKLPNRAPAAPGPRDASQPERREATRPRLAHFRPSARHQQNTAPAANGTPGSAHPIFFALPGPPVQRTPQQQPGRVGS